ncbi:hypothetical protein [Halorussus halobius]|uniref:hypothetical protein n=1 Tax=Halorussus halobius TaxID=1710537 RepID=UPI00109310F9|nr:hypothetical protein [Halorussus halobius]
MTDATDALEPGETVRERLALRTGGSVTVTDDRLLVAADGDLTRIALEEVAEVTVEEFDHWLGVLSVALVGYGLYSVSRNVALGLAFVAVGAGGCYWTYRKRGKARIEVAGRSRPISVFPTETDALVAALDPAMAADGDASGDA